MYVYQDRLRLGGEWRIPRLGLVWEESGCAKAPFWVGGIKIEMEIRLELNLGDLGLGFGFGFGN